MHVRQLVLERKQQPDTTTVFTGGDVGVLLTPAIDEDYWLYRVQLTDTQAIVAFPKFGIIGIGFAKEEDWNTNLPSSVAAESIYAHIKHNKGDGSISRKDCIAAINMIRVAIAQDKQA